VHVKRFIRRDRKPCTLSISVEYMDKEGVQEWTEAYLKRNKISWCFEKRHYGTYLVVQFKSGWQCDCFAWTGNKKFPYFEFL